MPMRHFDLAQFAAINLHYALEEVTSTDREAISRVLDHFRQAEHALRYCQVTALEGCE